MKPLLVSLFVLIIVAIAGVYVFVPSILTIDESTTVKVNPQAALRVLQDDAYWKKFLADNKSTYTIREKLYNQFKIGISNNSDTVSSILNIIPLNFESTKFQWLAVEKTSANPITRIRQYYTNSNRQKEIKSILTAMHNYMSKQENIYGANIHREVVTDTLMVTIKKEFNAPPSVQQVDSLLQILRVYVAQNRAQLVDSPMLHIDQLNQNSFSVQVALPTDKPLPNKGNIEFRRMIRGYMLIADIQGGQATVEKGILEIENFLRDYMRTSPAIPFELMLTHRVSEPDTSKWLTRIYYPVVL